MGSVLYYGCSVENCEGKHEARGLCTRHYQQAKKAGNLPPRKTLEERFWAKVDKNGPIHPELKTRCWVWTASTYHFGHGCIVLGDGSGSSSAHRVSWEIHNGKISSKLCVLHKCDNPPCVNPEHLFLGTRTDNHLDMVNKGRLVVDAAVYLRGDDHQNSKLTEEVVRECRTLHKSGQASIRELAKKHDVSYSTIQRVVTYASWQHID
jgi:hypothetical protein